MTSGRIHWKAVWEQEFHMNKVQKLSESWPL